MENVSGEIAKSASQPPSQPVAMTNEHNAGVERIFSGCGNIQALLICMILDRGSDGIGRMATIMEHLGPRALKDNRD